MRMDARLGADADGERGGQQRKKTNSTRPSATSTAESPRKVYDIHDMSCLVHLTLYAAIIDLW